MASSMVENDKGKPITKTTPTTTNKRKEEIKAKLNSGKHLPTTSFSVNGVVQISHASSIHLGHNMNVTSSTPAQKVLRPSDPNLVMNPQLKALLESDEDITVSHRLAVSSHVGSDWRLLGHELAGLSNSQMDQLEEPFKANLQPFEEVIYKMLLLWEETAKMRPTLGQLARALMKLKMHSALLTLSAKCV